MKKMLTHNWYAQSGECANIINSFVCPFRKDKQLFRFPIEQGDIMSSLINNSNWHAGLKQLSNLSLITVMWQAAYLRCSPKLIINALAHTLFRLSVIYINTRVVMTMICFNFSPLSSSLDSMAMTYRRLHCWELEIFVEDKKIPVWSLCKKIIFFHFIFVIQHLFILCKSLTAQVGKGGGAGGGRLWAKNI